MQITRPSRKSVAQLFKKPLLDLVYQAAGVHRQHHAPDEVQVCTLLSIKTAGCPEDCGYCSQSVHHNAVLKAESLLELEPVLEAARQAKAAGSTRFCMGAAWRNVRDGGNFDRVLEMVRGVKEMGLEVCVTLGMLSPEQARRLQQAGLTAYNHNLDTSESFYPKVISTRTYQDRLDTIGYVRDAGITVCCGGIIGLGESTADRIDLLHTLANLPKPPESVPINALVAVPGTPLENQQRVTSLELVRMIAVARILMPESKVRLSAGRLEMSVEEQALCFLAGANSIFAGERLLTTPNPEWEQDKAMFDALGLRAMMPEEVGSAGTETPATARA
ncbi:MAG: biotin synthase BioB [Proteobacteria bacterium]|nr:biotin synthase BioB [Pseudomonadota bacterium]